MVVLEAAAIGAASYGLYKGGEAGVKKGKDCQRELQRENKRSSQRSVLGQKTKKRSDRIKEIVNMKMNGGTNVKSANANASASVPNLNITSRSTDNNRRASTTTPTSTSTESYASRRQSLNEASSDVDDRHRNIMKKLSSSRQEESKKGKSNKLRSLNPFKKK